MSENQQDFSAAQRTGSVLDLTPKALANVSPGSSEPWGHDKKKLLNPERGSSIGEPFSGFQGIVVAVPGFSRRSNRWAEISQRLRR